MTCTACTAFHFCVLAMNKPQSSNEVRNRKFEPVGKALADHAVTSAPEHSGNFRANASRSASGLMRVFALSLFCGVAVLATGFFLYLSEIDRLANGAVSGPVDGIVVLTGGKARIETAIELLKDGKAKRLLISGAHPGSSSADIRRAVKGSRPLFDCCIDIDNAALDTVGNAEQSSRWAKLNGFRSIIVVTSDYHMPRSLIEFRRKMPGAVIIPFEASAGNSAIERLWADMSTMGVLMPEYAKYLAAVLRLGVREKTKRVAFASALSL